LSTFQHSAAAAEEFVKIVRTRADHQPCPPTRSAQFLLDGAKIEPCSTNPRNYFYSSKQFANPQLILIDFCLHRTKVDKNNQKSIAINYLFMKINQKLISQFFQLQNNLSFQNVFWLKPLKII
jgi:hypothetical protein